MNRSAFYMVIASFAISLHASPAFPAMSEAANTVAASPAPSAPPAAVAAAVPASAPAPVIAQAKASPTPSGISVTTDTTKLVAKLSSKDSAAAVLKAKRDSAAVVA
ncbi:MAG: hypothetical protein M3Y08_12950 [Fibrobacterota bacterium]|nr:hypothetical protein [Fibrobacterota bacterium]